MYPWHERLWHDLTRAFTAQQVPHAILITGPEYSGLEAVALQFMQLLACTRPLAELPCGECRSCTLFAGGGHPDLFRISPEPPSRQIRIEQIRTLVHQSTLTPMTGRRKVALISPAEAMNRNSANALLKTLEEPAGSGVLILLAHDPARLLPTIRSRCQVFSQSVVDQDAALGWLSKVLPEQDRKSCAAALLAASGLPLLARKYLEAGVLEQRRTVAKTLLALAVSQGDPLQAAREFADFNKADVWLWISGWMGGLARAQLSGEAPADPVVEAIQKYRPALSAARALQLAEQAGRARNMVDWPVREDLLLADWLIQWQSRN